MVEVEVSWLEALPLFRDGTMLPGTTCNTMLPNQSPELLNFGNKNIYLATCLANNTCDNLAYNRQALANPKPKRIYNQLVCRVLAYKSLWALG